MSRSLRKTGGFASSSATFATPPSPLFHHRSSSPTRVNLAGACRSPAVSFSSPVRSSSAAPRRTCMCSPTTHPGSFRCTLHKNLAVHPHHRYGGGGGGGGAASPRVSNSLNARRSAMTNSLVRIGTVEGDLVKRALAALIRPSSHHQRRRGEFRPRPSRLSVMSKADGHDCLS